MLRLSPRTRENGRIGSASDYVQSGSEDNSLSEDDNLSIVRSLVQTKVPCLPILKTGSSLAGISNLEEG
jgi:hypothetical protein